MKRCSYRDTVNMITTLQSQRQAIQTRYLCATNTRGSRIVATAECGRIVVEYLDELTSSDNHARAAGHFAGRMGWRGRWVGGPLRDGSYAFVCVAD